jgi:hypothetical protein
MSEMTAISQTVCQSRMPIASIPASGGGFKATYLHGIVIYDPRVEARRRCTKAAVQSRSVFLHCAARADGRTNNP